MTNTTGIPSRALPHSGPLDRLPSLDGLRAISIVIVLLGHLFATVGFPQPPDGPLGRLLDNPTLGVRVFFVISGFLITTLLLREENKHGAVSISGFYIRRALRILPPLWVYVLAVVAFELVIGQLKLGAALRALTFTTGGFVTGHGSKLLGHTWSLSVEEQFYLLWPLLFASLGMRGRVRLALAIVLAAPFARALLYFARQAPLIRQSIVGQGDLLMFGCLCALLLHARPALVQTFVGRAPGWGRAVATLMLLALQQVRGPGTGYFSVPLSYTFEGVLLGYLVLSFVVVRQGAAYRLLNLRPVSWLGTLSYSLYLWQQLWLYPDGGDGYGAYAFQRFPQCLLGAVVCAVISYYFVEQPFLRRKERLSTRAHGSGQEPKAGSSG